MRFAFRFESAKGNAIGILLVTSMASTTAFSLGLLNSRPPVLTRSSVVSHTRTARNERSAASRILMGLDSSSYDNRKRQPSKHDLIQDFLTQRSVQVHKHDSIWLVSLYLRLISFHSTVSLLLQTLMHNMKVVGDVENLEYLENFLDHQG